MEHWKSMLQESNCNFCDVETIPTEQSEGIL